MEKNLKVYFAENGLLVRDNDGDINAKVQLYPSNGAVRAVGELVWKSIVSSVDAEASVSDTEICTLAEGVDIKIALTPFGVTSTDGDDNGTDTGDGGNTDTDTPTDGGNTTDTEAPPTTDGDGESTSDEDNTEGDLLEQ